MAESDKGDGLVKVQYKPGECATEHAALLAFALGWMRGERVGARAARPDNPRRAVDYVRADGFIRAALEAAGVTLCGLPAQAGDRAGDCDAVRIESQEITCPDCLLTIAAAGSVPAEFARQA